MYTKQKTNYVAALLVAFGIIASSSPRANATPTAVASPNNFTSAGTLVDNKAVVNYKVGTVDQTLIESSPTGNSTPGSNQGAATRFVVDNKVDLLVQQQDGAAVSVVPGEQDAYLTFRVTNEGNETQDYALTATDVTIGVAAAFGGLNDGLDIGTTIYIDDGDGVFDGDDTAATFIDGLAPDFYETVFIVVDVPLTATDTLVASYHLSAVTHDETGAGLGTLTAADSDGPSAGSVATDAEVVFGDGAGSLGAGSDDANDGIHSDQDDFQVVSASLEITKDSCVYSDPINGTPATCGDGTYSIPGAEVQYTITVENTGNAAAGTVVVTDEIPDNTIFVVGTVAAGTGTVTYSNNDGSTFVYTPSADANGNDSNVTDIRVEYASVAGSGGSVDTVFRVEVE